MTAVALLNGGLHFLLVFMALATAEDISSVAILLQTYVPFSAILAVFLLGERIGWRSALAIATAFAGVLLVSLDPVVFANLESVGLCLLSALSLALGTNLMRGLKKTNPFTFQAFTALVSIPVLLPFALYYEDNLTVAVANADWIHWGAVAYSGLISSVIGHGLLFYLVQRNPVSEVTPHLLLAPILAIVFGILIWGDQPGWRLWTGGAMVLGGVLGVAIRARKRHEVISEHVEATRDI